MHLSPHRPNLFALRERPLLNGWGWSVNHSPAFAPPLYVSSGLTYWIEVDSYAEHRLELWVQREDGLVQYEEGISQPAIYQGRLSWTVTEKTPRQLIYSSGSSDAEGPNTSNIHSLTGLIVVDSAPTALSNGLQLLRTDAFADTMQDLVEKFNQNARVVLTQNDSIAGEGLVKVGRTLKLDRRDEGVTYFRLPEGGLVRADTTWDINDQSQVRNPQNLSEALDLVATLLRQAKDPTQPWHESPVISLRTAFEVVEEAQKQVAALAELYSQLEKRLTDE